MIGVTLDGHVTTLELQREERRNALNTELVEGLREAIVKAAAEDVRAIVLTGQGTVFCAGADLSGDAFAADYPDRLIALHKAIDQAPMPVIGAINGPAVGFGATFTLAMDVRLTTLTNTEPAVVVFCRSSATCEADPAEPLGMMKSTKSRSPGAVCISCSRQPSATP